MSAQMKLNLGNTPQVLSLAGGMFGAQQLVLTFGTNPASGTVSIEVMPVGGVQWVALTKATNLPVTGAPYFIRSNGWINKVRVTFNSVVGGTDAWIWAEQVDLPTGLFEGLAAITTQPYTEANVKNGLEFYLRASWSLYGAAQVPAHGPIPAGETRKIHFVTTTKNIIVKLRDFAYAAEELTLALYAGPTGVTGGSPLVISNYNAINPVATTVSATRDVATVSDGVEFGGGDREVFFGANAVAQRTGNSIQFGRERILPAGGDYIVAITNTGKGSARVQYLLDWYEGETDLPL